MTYIGFPPVLFPSTSWIFKWLTTQSGVIVSDWTWQKQSAFNRFYIDGPNGIQTLTIPVKHPAQGAKINEIEISYHFDWRAQHLKTLHSTYNNSPFYEFLENNLEDLYNFQPVLLIEFSLASINLCLYWLKEKKITQVLPKKQGRLQFIDIELKKGIIPNVTIRQYPQVFSYKNGFLSGLSCIDLIFNEGNLSKSHLLDC